MVDLAALLGLVGVTLLFLLPPGPDMAYMVTVGLHGGRGAALKAILGIGTGMTLYAAAAVAGIGEIAGTHPLLFDVVQICGAAFLLWMAYTTVGTHRDSGDDAAVEVERWYVRGLWISLSNPKIMLFYVAVLPRFLGDAQNIRLQLAVLGLANVVMEVVLYGGLGVLAGVFRARSDPNPRLRVVLGYLAALVYVLLAAVIVIEVVAH